MLLLKIAFRTEALLMYTHPKITTIEVDSTSEGHLMCWIYTRKNNWDSEMICNPLTDQNG
jgi:hypothetical protein